MQNSLRVDFLEVFYSFYTLMTFMVVREFGALCIGFDGFTKWAWTPMSFERPAFEMGTIDTMAGTQLRIDVRSSKNLQDP